MQKAVSYLYHVFLGILIAVFALLAFYVGQNVYADFTNTKPLFRLYTIISPSMEPNLKVYDIVVVKKLNAPSEINVSDVITFYSNTLASGEYTITHRVDDIITKDNKLYFQTKGDNNPLRDDGLTEFENIEGKVVLVISGLGHIQSFIISAIGWLILILVPAVIMIIIDIIKIIKIKKQQKTI